MTTLSHYDIIRRPVITEKSTAASEHNKVVFVVAPTATKPEIKEAVEALFKVKVKAVNTIVRKGKNKRFRGIAGRTSDSKRAIVTLVDACNIETWLADQSGEENTAEEQIAFADVVILTKIDLIDKALAPAREDRASDRPSGSCSFRTPAGGRSRSRPCPCARRRRRACRRDRSSSGVLRDRRVPHHVQVGHDHLAGELAHRGFVPPAELLVRLRRIADQ